MTETIPWVKWRFDRWRGDESLRICTLAARGLWIEILCIMHGCEPYGHLSINGRSPSAKQIASLVGMASEREVVGLLQELEDAGVFSRSPDGMIYCRRMVRDNDARALGRATGAKGGNPNLIGKRQSEVNQTLDLGLTPPVDSDVKTEKREEIEREKERKKGRVPPVTPLSESDAWPVPSAKRAGPTPRGTRLPEDWQPRDEERDLAVNRGVDVIQATEEFRNYWISVAGKGGAKLDWDRTFRNRLVELAEKGRFPISGLRPATPIRNGFIAVGYNLAEGRAQRQATKSPGSLFQIEDKGEKPNGE